MAQGRTHRCSLAGTHRLWAVPLLLAAIAAGAAATSRAAAPGASNWAVVLATIQGGETLVWQRLPEDPAPRELARIRHEPDFLPRASVSPDGRWLAYTWLPEGSGPQAVRTAHVDLVDLASATTTQLASGVDLRSAPLWSTAGTGVLVRRTYQSEDAPSRVELHALPIADPGGAQALVAEEADALVPLLWSPDGTLLYGRWHSGVDLRRLDPGAPEPRNLARLSDGPAHNLSLSPDGQTVAYTRPLGRGAPGQHSLFLVSLATGTARPVWSEPSDHLNPVWRPAATELTIATHSPTGGLAAVQAAASGMVASPRAIQTWQANRLEVPLQWSPDGRWLAVRSLLGDNAYALTGEELVLVDANSGARQTINGAGYTSVVGWRPAGP